MEPINQPQITSQKIGKFKGSKLIALESLQILKQDKEMMLFPILSCLINISVTLLLLFVLFLTIMGKLGVMEKPQGGAEIQSIFIMFGLIISIVNLFITNFFQSGLYVIANARFSGRDASFRDGISESISLIDKILIWSLISGIVGFILQNISERSKTLGKIIAALLGAAWSILTFFSLPSLILGKTSIKDSFTQSASIIRKTWGETIIINLGAGLIFTLISVFSILLGVILALLFIKIIPIFVAVIILTILFNIVVIIFSSTLNSIFRVALYRYATTGEIPQGFTPELIKNAISGKNTVNDNATQ